MLPFSNIEFYLYSLIGVISLYSIKGFLKKFISYEVFLFLISILFAGFIYPKPFHLLGFVLYSFGAIILLQSKFKNIHRLIGSLIIAAPLILIKTKSVHGWLEFAGASYITFRTIQVYIDYDSISSKLNFVRFTSFLLFIPTLLVGPIDRYGRFVGDLESGYMNLNRNQFLEGWNAFLLGVLQKYVLAAFVSKYWLDPIDSSSMELLTMLNNMFAYTSYLYFDFAGYSHLAMGLGYIVGIKVPDNFNQPYLSLNPQEFWKRWHITLGDWLRDYFFRPIYKELSSVKSLKSWPLAKQNASLFLTFGLMGCWNGFKSYYIVSGCLLGFYSVIHNSHNYYSKKYDKDIFTKMPIWLYKTVSISLMIFFVSFALYIFSGRFPYLHS